MYCLIIPKEYGGIGAGMPGNVVAAEQLAHARPSTASPGTCTILLSRRSTFSAIRFCSTDIASVYIDSIIFR
ncbi:acyl-CoA dehydrogenase family protein [Polycladomyces subterraneus]|uniref:acyl-CoA dehydrogenase family protein n=1 Tax=Polycladomyces subterraneus TaxID=1016997 RepID=UPI003413278E